MAASIVVDGLGVRFLLDRQRRPMTPGMSRLRRRTTVVWGLRGVDVTIGPGESVALVGPNGAGKSTLLRALAGVLPADEGRVSVRGRIGSLLAVDSGLMPQLTGRENALLLGVLSGLPRREVERALGSIAVSTGLEAAFDRPVRTYSVGMRARLGFAVLDHADPDVLLLDEVHEALDQRHRERLAARAAAITDRGGIVVAAGHDRVALAGLCDHALALGGGGVVPTALAEPPVLA